MKKLKIKFEELVETRVSVPSNCGIEVFEWVNRVTVHGKTFFMRRDTFNNWLSAGLTLETMSPEHTKGANHIASVIKSLGL